MQRGRGDGTIYRRADGRWEARVLIGGLTGRRRSFYGETREEARGKMLAALRDVGRGVAVPGDRLTLGKFLADWMAGLDDQVRPLTARRYRQLMVKYVIPVAGRVPLTKLTPHHVQAILKSAGALDASPRTVHHVRAVLRGALNQAVRWDLVVRNAAALATAPRVPDRADNFIDLAEAQRILAAMRGTRLEVIVTVALYMGLRQGEVLGLRWGDVDFEHSTLRVRRAMQWLKGANEPGRLVLVDVKTAKSRRALPLPATVAEALQQHRAVQDAERRHAGSVWSETMPGLVFTSATGLPLHGTYVTHQYQRQLRGAGIEHRTFHELRHACATFLLAAGIDLKVVSDLLGHSTITLTANTYAGVLPHLKQAAADQIDALLGPAGHPPTNLTR